MQVIGVFLGGRYLLFTVKRGLWRKSVVQCPGISSKLAKKVDYGAYAREIEKIPRKKEKVVSGVKENL